MSQPAQRQDRFRPVPERQQEWPVIHRHREAEVLRQRGQVTYLLWRCEMFMRDRGAPKHMVREYMESVRKIWARGNYEATCKQIELIMKRFLQAEFDQVQAIFNER